MRTFCVPKGDACALHLTREYREGQVANPHSRNPYDFFDEYEKHYAFCIGNQKGADFWFTMSSYAIKKFIEG